MKIIKNSIIPFKGYKAINLFGVLFVRKGVKIDRVTLTRADTQRADLFQENGAYMKSRKPFTWGKFL